MKATAALLAIILLASCTKHDVRALTPWLEVDVQRPVTGDSGVILLGSKEQVFRVKVGGRWRRLGTGRYSAYFILGDGGAALVDLHDRKGLQLVTDQSEPRPVSGDVTISAGGEWFDVFTCRVQAERAGCVEADIDRTDSRGAAANHFTLAMPPSYAGCAFQRIIGYDRDEIPYVVGQCRPDASATKCVLAAPRKDGPFLYAVGADQPWTECSDFRGAHVSLTAPQSFTVLQ